MNVFILQAALEDLLEATEHFDKQSAGLGLRFRQCVAKTIERIIAFPKACAVLRKSYRIRQVMRFRKYGILYRIKLRRIFVHGIIHLQRGPRFWQARI